MQKPRPHSRPAESESDLNKTSRESCAGAKCGQQGFGNILEPVKPAQGFFSRCSVDVLSIRNVARAPNHREVSSMWQAILRVFSLY